MVAIEGSESEDLTKNEQKIPSTSSPVKNVKAPIEDAANEKKNYRKRKRHHFNAIRAQMEFYFGDANLSKDRFLKQLIDKDPFIPLDTFLTFNKIKALTSSVEEIAKALSNSELLELDESSEKVRRKTALPVDRNADEKTLYVESLPPTADHDWVRRMFERFGPIAYISLPKYAKSKKIKEFGFIEFEQEDSVAKAVKSFEEFNGVLQMENSDPGELISIKSYIKEQNEAKSESPGDKDECSRKKGGKKKRKNESEDETDKPQTKKIKVEDTVASKSGDPGSPNLNRNESSAAETETGEDTAKEEEDAKDIAGGETKKKRRKSKKRKIKIAEKLKKEVELNADASYYELKILPKRQWKSLRNKYLNLQREKVRELKRKQWQTHQGDRGQSNENSSEAPADAMTSPPPSKKSKPNERKLQGMNMNFYGAGEAVASAKEAKQNPALERAPLFSYEPGLIVEVGLLEPCVNVKEFKADMRQYPAVKYIDVKEGVMQAYLRLESSAAAENFVRQVGCAEYKCKVISGEAEVEYWQKIEKDREMKLNKKVKVPQKRGREKVKKLVAKHIRFGDDNET